MSPGRSTLLGALAVAAGACTWGTLGFFAKLLYAEGVSFEALVAFRAFFGWVTVMLLLTATGKLGDLRVSRQDLAFLVPLGVVGIGLFYLFYFFTVQESTVGTAAILLYSAPAFVVVLARVFLGETLNSAKLSGLLLTAVGIFLVAGAYDPANLEMSGAVLVVGLLSGLSYGLYAIFGRPVAGHLSPAVVLAYALLFGSLLLVPVSLPTLDTLAGLSAGAYGILVMLAVVHTAVGFALYTFGIRHLGAGRAAIVATVEPVVAGAMGVALLGEALTAAKLAGGLLVLAGAVIAQAPSGRFAGK